MGGWVLRMTWGHFLCFTVNQCPHCNELACHSGVTQGWLGVGKRVVWAVGYIQQFKAHLASSSGIRWGVRFPDQNRQTKALCWWDDNNSLGDSDRGLAMLPWLEPTLISISSVTNKHTNRLHQAVHNIKLEVDFQVWNNLDIEKLQYNRQI